MSRPVARFAARLRIDVPGGILGWAALLLATLGPGAARAATPLEELLEAHARPVVHDEFYCALAVGVVRGDETLVRGFGRVSPDSDAPPDGSTVFEIGSITKGFTGILLALASIEGGVSLDDPITKWMPGGAPPPERDGATFTLGQLASHVSGLPRLPVPFEPADPANPYADFDDAKLDAFVAGARLLRAPGEKYLYSNVGFGILGRVLAREAGSDYESLARSRLLEPLAMRDTAILLDDSMRARLAAPCEKPGVPAHNWDIPTLAGAGALRSTADDMTRFLRANLHPPEGPLGDAIRLSHRPRHPIRRGVDVALGWHVVDLAGPGVRMVWHDGGTGGYHSFFGVSHEIDAGVVVLGSGTANAMDAAARAILETIAREFPAR